MSDLFASDESLLAMAERLNKMAGDLLAETAKFMARIEAETQGSGAVALATATERKAHPIKELLTAFDLKHVEKFKAPANIQGGKDSQIMKRLLTTYGRERVLELIDLFFDCDDTFVHKAGFTVGVFQSKIASLIAQTAAPRVAGMTAKTESNRANAATASAMIKRAYDDGHPRR